MPKPNFFVRGDRKNLLHFENFMVQWARERGRPPVCSFHNTIPCYVRWILPAASMAHDSQEWRPPVPSCAPAAPLRGQVIVCPL